MGLVDELVDYCFNNPEQYKPVENFAPDIKHSIELSYQATGTEATDEALAACSRDVLNRVTWRISDVLQSGCIHEGFTDEDITNYMNLCSRMREVYLYGKRIASFIATYNDWKDQF